MDNKKLSRAAAKAYTPLLNSYSVCPEAKDHIFSEDFERKIDKALTAKSRNVKKLKLSWKMALIMIVVFLSGFCIGAARVPLHELIIRLFGGNAEIAVEDSYSNNKIGMDTIYELYDLPNGFEMENKYITPTASEHWYRNGERCIALIQYKSIVYKDVFLGDDVQHEYFSDENGQEYICIQDNENTSIVWKKGEYVFLLFGDLDKYELIDLCKHTKEE